MNILISHAMKGENSLHQLYEKWGQAGTHEVTSIYQAHTSANTELCEL
jgi:hypothetical protein